MSAPKDITGKRFNRLTAIGPVVHEKLSSKYWVFHCLCGSTTNKVKTQVVYGKIKSCGCLFRKHSMSGTVEYRTWEGILARCKNKNDRGYKAYGGRGITVCKKWSTFLGFYEDMGARPSKDHSIDRIDNNAGYNKKNCRWATRVEQSNNRRNNKVIVFKGKKYTVAQLARTVGMRPRKLAERLRHGTPLIRAMDNNKLIKTHCSRGHKYTKRNTVDKPNTKGRVCKICYKRVGFEYNLSRTLLRLYLSQIATS